MQKQRPTTQSPDIPKWSALLVEAVNKPGLIMKAYSAFWNYSIGNQILALVQCQLRGIQPGPINTFPKWQTLGRVVKRGERALTLCMPLTRKRRNDQSTDDGDRAEEQTYTTFVHKARWFVISQTSGSELGPITIPEWDAERALKTLCIKRITFDKTDGNCQGFARGRQIAINPVAQLPHKTLFHEMAHVIMHTSDSDFTDTEQTPRNLREVEAESVALLCCEALGFEGADYARGYIQNWLYQGVGYNADAIPEKSAQRILRTADQILRAGRPAKKQPAEFAN
ncbi:MAG TPA: ArdC-like ssDNA-binding domain-containing protein [Pyrinomonadaceae bacterium]|nr:ArdC-like ssDNA-binding domain-containing protein [Pyrinomonadaceae bacterium]